MHAQNRTARVQNNREMAGRGGEGVVHLIGEMYSISRMALVVWP